MSLFAVAAPAFAFRSQDAFESRTPFAHSTHTHARTHRDFTVVQQRPSLVTLRANLLPPISHPRHRTPTCVDTGPARFDDAWFGNLSLRDLLIYIKSCIGEFDFCLLVAFGAEPTLSGQGLLPLASLLTILSTGA